MMIFKRAAVRALLFVIFVLIAASIVRALLADIEFGRAERLEASYLTMRAEGAYRRAIRIDPYSAVYPSGFADYLRRKARYQDHPVPPLLESERLYTRSLELNSMDALAALALGETEIALFLNDRDKFAGRLPEGFKNFRRAIENDPNGFNVSYTIGYSGISIWSRLDERQKKFTLERLRHAILLRPGCSKYIYPEVWSATNDFSVLQNITPDNFACQSGLYSFVAERGLWQFRSLQAKAVSESMKRERPLDLEKDAKEKAQLLKSIMMREALKRKATNVIGPEEWRGTADDGNNRYKQGAMYWTGAMHGVLRAPGGPAAVIIEASGESAGGIYPYMVVEMDGEEIGEAFVDSSGMKEYSFKASSPPGARVISVRFMNDGGYGREDRNLYIGKARIENGGG